MGLSCWKIKFIHSFIHSLIHSFYQLISKKSPSFANCHQFTVLYLCCHIGDWAAIHPEPWRAVENTDATAGHIGIKRTTTHIPEGFMWNGIVKDVKEMVSAPLFLSFKYTTTEQECITRHGIRKLFQHYHYFPQPKSLTSLQQQVNITTLL